MPDQRDFVARRAIEALRAGVPNRDAVRALGCAQPLIEEKFQEALSLTAEAALRGEQAPGLIISGDFGTGKSHLLEYLHHLALQANFVSSRVVVSKETPLYDPARFYRAAMNGAVVPGRTGAALTEIAMQLKFDSREFAEFTLWANRGSGELNSRFPASLFLYESVNDFEIRDRIISFWAGDPINTIDLRRWLRNFKETASYRIEKVRASDLFYQRFAFTSRLIRAAGYAGWLLLIDEAELIGRYSWKQRAKSYAEIARWSGKLTGEEIPGLTSVIALMADYDTAVLSEQNRGKGDWVKIPGRLRATGADPDMNLAARAERGMRLIRSGRMELRRADESQFAEARDRVREMHALAYHWTPPSDGLSDTRSTSTPMRESVRRWIIELDLKRLYPQSHPEMVVSELAMDYTESPDLEQAGDPDPVC